MVCAAFVACAAMCTPALASDNVDARRVDSEFNRIDTTLQEMEAKLRFLRTEFSQPKERESLAYRVQRRLNDGQIFFEAKDYVRSSIVFFDVINTKGLESHPGYNDALYHLAEGLYQSENFLGARRYFQQLLDRMGSRSNRYLQDAVLRLVQIAFRIDNHEGVDQYYALLSNIPTADIKNETKYIYGKSVYRRQAYDDAYDVFGGIQPPSEFALRAAYFRAVIRVAQDRVDDSVAEFEKCLAMKPTSDEDKRTRDLAALALGRIYQEQGQLAQSVDQYQKVDRDSAYFDEYLFEVAWTLIKQGEYEKALRALDILMLSTNNKEFVPEAKLLKGNLYLRLNNFDKAVEVFDEVVATYSPIKQELDKLIEGRDTEAYFNEVARAAGAELDAKSVIPPVALEWASGEDDMAKAVSVVSDLEDSKRFVGEADRVIARLLSAVEGDQTAIELFPTLRAAKTRAVEIENQMLEIRTQLTGLETEILSAKASDAELRSLEAARQERLRLEEAFKSLPKTKQEMEKRDAAFGEDIAEFEKEVYKSGFQVDAMKAQIRAIRQWFVATEGQRQGEPEAIERFQSQLRFMQGVVEQLDEQYQELMTELTQERLRSGGMLSKEDEVRVKYNEALSQEQELLQRIRSGLDVAGSAMVQRIESFRSRLDKMNDGVDVFYDDLNEMMVAAAKEFRTEVEKESELIAEYGEQVGEIENESQELTGLAAYKAFEDVRRKFNALLLQADVGIIDVVWRQKQVESRRIRDLAMKERDEVKKLDDEFDEVLNVQQ